MRKSEARYIHRLESCIEVINKQTLVKGKSDERFNEGYAAAMAAIRMHLNDFVLLQPHVGTPHEGR